MTNPQENEPESDSRIGAAGWVAIAVLALFLIAACGYAVHAWNRMEGVTVSPLGWVFMGLGVIVTILVGGGLMALVFYSSRKNYDQ